MTENEVQNIMDFVLPLVLVSGEELLKIEAIDASKVEVKTNFGDLVTIYDKKLEKLLLDKLKENYPDHKFIAEEDTAEKDCQPELTDAPTWIIDPIDGTMNFVKMMPVSAISVALSINKHIVLGIIYNPYMNELYTAIKGQGAFLNGKEIKPSTVTEIKKSILNFELSLATKSLRLRNLFMSRLDHIIDKVAGIRSYGCAALGICYVACGRVDAYECDDLCPWDVAAASLIVQEAGGFLIDSSGGPFEVMKPNVLAAGTKELLQQYLTVLQAADRQETSSNDK